MGLLLPLTALATPAQAAGLFGAVELSSNNLASFTKWVGVRARIRAQNDTLEACQSSAASCPGNATRRWRAMMETAGAEDAQSQLAAVNGFFNGFPYIEDIDNYGKSDYWITPLEFLKKSGDCEDYAISKFVSLRLLGWRNDDLRLVIVRDTVRGVNHAVLAARLGNGREMVLDNLASEPLPSTTVLQYSPYYAVNETTRWIFVKPAR